ncbi:aminotransferase class V-fold PLP-dependent enzyme [Sphingobium sp. CR2-8]|uniref:pyridoxal-phosphate-dependent aminotransferase family protein n=1 Tax=Sphingobium sp. CR2-8 TaxID=1306534 RepID=UPI002DB8D4BE|nr:aminotransferase class V-fold PLP-dependent enzyme [Sphingobium sp. CR2-8]MEC3909446.1 aminotransferase class V-fold PLP-dependent enzyme [Sphingobium sp. CR2-8]
MATSHGTLNMTTGPVEVSPSVGNAGVGVIASPHIGNFWELHDRTVARLGTVLGTRSTVLAVPGSIRMGISLAFANFVEPGMKVLAISNGFWGELLGAYMRERGAIVTELKTSDLAPVPIELVEQALRKERFDLVSIVHCETNAGIVNPIAQIGAMVAGTDALYFVDTACSAGAQPVETDESHIDIGVTGSHKCLGSLPGLAILTLSGKALSRIEGRNSALCSLSIASLRREILDRPQRPLFTLPPTLFHSLATALEELEADGLDAWFARHRAVAARFRESMRELGMTMLPELAGTDDRHLSVAVQAVHYPEGIDDGQFRHRLATEHGIHVIGNIGAWQGRSFRLGLMSAPQMADETLSRVIGAIGAVLAH